ncbi:MAG TPA: hypothetical protein VJU82_06560, partial [Acidobacteriaceae bacterium]|nr:hypothetical protein [Acidobacteriaceae bacterium]
TERDQRDDGLIAFAVPQGISAIDIRYIRGLDDLAGDGISLIAVFALLAALSKRNTSRVA